MTWLDIEDIADALLQAHPQADPLAVRFLQLKQWTLELPGFTGTPEDCNERKLEAIQMAWHEARTEQKQDDGEQDD